MKAPQTDDSSHAHQEVGIIFAGGQRFDGLRGNWELWFTFCRTAALIKTKQLSYDQITAIQIKSPSVKGRIGNQRRCMYEGACMEISALFWGLVKLYCCWGIYSLIFMIFMFSDLVMILHNFSPYFHFSETLIQNCSCFSWIKLCNYHYLDVTDGQNFKNVKKKKKVFKKGSIKKDILYQTLTLIPPVLDEGIT